MKDSLYTWGYILLALNSIEYFKQRKCISKRYYALDKPKSFLYFFLLQVLCSKYKTVLQQYRRIDKFKEHGRNIW